MGKWMSSPGERVYTTVSLSSNLSPAAVRVLRQRRDSSSSPYTTFESDTMLKQLIVVRQVVTYDLRSPTTCLAIPRLAGSSTNEKSPTSLPRPCQPPHQSLKRCILVRRAGIYALEASARTQELADTAIDSAAPSSSRKPEHQTPSAICTSSTLPASLFPPCKLNDLRFTLMTLGRLWLRRNYSSLTLACRIQPRCSPVDSSAEAIEFRPASGVISQLPCLSSQGNRLASPERDLDPRLRSEAGPSTLPAILASASALELVIHPRFSLQARPLYESVSLRASRAHPEPFSAYAKLPSAHPKLPGTLFTLLDLPIIVRRLPNDLITPESLRAIYEGPRVIYKAPQLICPWIFVRRAR
ncbi:uncharacterized protein SCHCODRAFT_02717927 [Schizophyllum commune H4-8]|nr:uncharacterized protein SCHCODRAFT_02673198 [Schizophyllum commune H4-8]XP_050197507.1 uncharacterized protein SCHCODRAFT_02717927 [Schizophyllum commune H4-8]KAI5886170.1 hypothetical protein SCHCODRAFT_02717927 [Schizophyllum commune H4-8]KAI5886177.1 hypothetical protein SCHCODRAFT_02673198 [Schizophyllum commune H4-8]